MDLGSGKQEKDLWDKQVWRIGTTEMQRKVWNSDKKRNRETLYRRSSL